MQREIINPKEIDRTVALAEYKKSMEGVKEGSPVDDMLDVENENSIFSQYLKKKREEYEERMENFDEEIEEIIESREDKDENVTIAGGEGTYTKDDFISSSDSQALNQGPINPDKVIDDLI